MEYAVKGLVFLAALTFILGILAALTGGDIRGFPAESFSRACDNFALIAIAVMLLRGKGQAATPGV
jgi:hypothetical protein